MVQKTTIVCILTHWIVSYKWIMQWRHILYKVSADFNDLDKTKGFLNHAKTTFEFIGPDKEPVKLDSIDKYLQVDEIIRNTGCPN